MILRGAPATRRARKITLEHLYILTQEQRALWVTLEQSHIWLWNNHCAGTLTLEQWWRWNNHIFDSGTTIALKHLLWNSDDAGTASIALEQSLSKLWNTWYSGTAIKSTGTTVNGAGEHPCSGTEIMYAGTTAALEQRQNTLEQRSILIVAVPA